MWLNTNGLGRRGHENFVDIHLFKAVMAGTDLKELKIPYDTG